LKAAAARRSFATKGRDEADLDDTIRVAGAGRHG
jgi:hypothetical protein